MGWSWLRSLYTDRPRRLWALYLSASAVFLSLALYFPLVLLVIGPLVWGVPHLFAGIRYVPRLTGAQGQRRRLFRFLTFILATIALYRLYTDYLNPQSALNEYGLLPEWVSVALTFMGCAALLRVDRKTLVFGTALVASFLYLAWSLPLWTTGALVLAHNFVAFFYWIAAARARYERRVAWQALGLFTLLNVVLFSGGLDWALSGYQPMGYLSWGQLDYEDIGRLIAPWSENYVIWYYCVVAYAFGQSLHYFVWLKAIPDQEHRSEIPTSFRQSWRLLVEDFGKSYARYLALFIFATFGVWAFFSMAEARVLYFALAAYHGYLEIAGLGLLKLKAV